MALLLTTLTWSGISAEINNNNNNNWLCKFISMTITEMNNYNWQLNVRDSVTGLTQEASQLTRRSQGTLWPAALHQHSSLMILALTQSQFTANC